MHSALGAVKRYALDRGFELHQPEKLRADSVERVQAARPDALVVAAYGLLMPQAVLDAAPRGAWNIHASLLPRWRGAAPIQRALLEGDRQTGISIMKMDAGLDTGPVLTQRAVAVGEGDDAGSLHDRLAQIGAEMIVAALAQVEKGDAQPVPQPAMGATYAPKIGKQETVLDWGRSAVELERAIRAFRPVPGAATVLQAESLKIWRAQVAKDRGAPGEVLRSQAELVVACGEGALQILELQRSGGKRLGAEQFLRGRPLAPGVRFG
jgi:methionyl-tRNA formyltransferase